MYCLMYCLYCYSMQGHLDVVDVGPALSRLSTLTLLDLYHPHEEAPFVVRNARGGGGREGSFGCRLIFSYFGDSLH